MTPPRLCQLRCPCGALHWVIDSDFRGISDDAPPYSEREYRCPTCGRAGAGFELLQQSPPRFLIDLHGDGAPRGPDHAGWLHILRTEFPDWGKPPPPPLAMLWFRLANYTSRSTLDGTAAVLGNGPAATIDLQDPSVAPRHAELGRSSDGWYVQDLDSGTGTGVGAKILRGERSGLRSGDLLTLGALRGIFLFTSNPGHVQDALAALRRLVRRGILAADAARGLRRRAHATDWHSELVTTALDRDRGTLQDWSAELQLAAARPRWLRWFG